MRGSQQPAGRVRVGGIVGVAVLLVVLGLLAAAVGLPAGDDGASSGSAQPDDGSAEPAGAASPSTPEPTGSPAPTEAVTGDEAGDAGSATDAPAPGEPVDLGGLVDQVADIRQLRPLGPLDVRRLDDSEMADLVSELTAAELEADALERDGRLLTNLRLIDPADDLEELLDRLYRSSIVGLYVPEDGRLYLAAEGPELSPYARFTAAHEVVHALQDQRYDLEQLRDLPEEETDASLAVLSLIEGDAVVTQQLWSLQHLDGDERTRLGAEALQRAGNAPEDMPAYLRRALEFPYREGAAFVGALVPGGNLGALAAVYESPPTTTEQILHPDKYRAGEEAVPAPVPESIGAESAGWEPTVTYSFGEFDLAELLRPLGDAAARSGAAGWGGGTVRLWERGPAHATSLALAFDSAQDGQEGCTALGDWYEAVAGGTEVEEGVFAGDRDVMAIACSGATVRVGLGGNADTAVAARGPGAP